jgi:AmmeMemoRadiSam system protein B
MRVKVRDDRERRYADFGGVELTPQPSSLNPHPLFRPRLRPGLAAARDERDPFAVILFDQLRISRQMLRLTAREFTWLQWLDGANTLRDVQLIAMRNGGGELLPLEPLSALVERLDAALFLDGPRFAERLTGPIREPACIGCYPADPDELRVSLDGYFAAGPGKPQDVVGWVEGSLATRRPTIPNGGGPSSPSAPRPHQPALLAPHIDYARGGVSYAWGYKELAERCTAGLFVIVGTSHYSPARFTLTRQDFKTPLGVVPTDQAYVDRLVAHYGDGLFDDPIAHVPEHSIELEVVFLQHLFGRRPIRIVPLLVGSFGDCVDGGTDPADVPDIARMVEALRRAEAECSEPMCYIISGDLAHVGPKFGDRGAVKPAFLKESRSQDEAILKQAEVADPDGYYRVIAAEGDRRRICGLPPTWTVLSAIRPKSGRVLYYDQYVHPRGSESVSFASAAFYA